MTLTALLKQYAEATHEHTGLLRLGLAEPESREYWRHAERQLPLEERVRRAFEERWFGSRSMTRVRYLVLGFQARFNA